MKNGKEYCHLIHQQIINLLEKAYLSDNERIIINKLDFGKMIYNLLFLIFYLIRNFIIGFT
jgi:hypothetical protein